MEEPILGIHYSPFNLEEVDLYIDRDEFLGEEVVLISNNYNQGADQINGEIRSGQTETPHEFGWEMEENELEIIVTGQGVQSLRAFLESDKTILSSRTGTKGYKINFYDARNSENLDPGTPYHFLTNYREKGVGGTLGDKINNIFREEA